MIRTLLVVAGLGAACSRALADAPDAGVEPTAPLASFSHKVHVSENEIGCGVCHPNARHAQVAGLASMQTCAGCHKFVGKDNADVQRLMAAFDQGKAIEWPRIHRLPDHVWFSHQPHLGAGLECSACHGEMKQRTFAVQQQPFTMGFCVECHQSKSAPTDCLACHK
jgi:Cytochrome c7 and related cytochrome c/Class III cytochrome C family